MEPKANVSDHRYSSGQLVEYGTGGPHGRDKLGRVAFEARQFGRDSYLIIPLSPGPGDGTMASVWPGDMVSDYQPRRWRADDPHGRWVRTYLELEFRSERAALAVSQREGVAAGRGLWGPVVERDGWWYIEDPPAS
jgi:hypothetical protein